MNLRSIDLNLLVIFEALAEERSVSKAARRVGLTQSAVSHALKRLRGTFDDELLIRTRTGMNPTPHALRIAAAVRAALTHVEVAVNESQRFDPRTSERSFKLRVSEYVAVSLLPSLCRYLRSEAPGISLEVERFDEMADDDAIGADEIQVRLASDSRVAGGWKSARLLEDDFVVLMRKGHPAARRRMTLERYITLPHLKVAAGAVGTNMIDDALHRRGLTRRVVVRVPSSLEMRQVVEETDLVTVVPRHWLAAREFSERFVSVPLPLEEVKFVVDQRWHARDDRDAGHAWLREVIARQFGTGGPAAVTGA